MSEHSYDAVVVGAGPNGLAAAIRMAQAGCSVLLVEANEEVGGAARSLELTLPHFVHDAFSGVYPIGISSPFFRSLPLAEHGLEWLHAPVALAHPLDDGTAVLLEGSLAGMEEQLGGRQGAAYRKVFEPFVEGWDELSEGLLHPFTRLRHPIRLARFGMRGVRSAEHVASDDLRGGRGGLLFAGSAAHCGLPLDFAGTAAYGLVLNAAGHAVGWPLVRGGAGAIPGALASVLRSLGGEIRTGWRVRSLRELPPARATFLSVTPRQVLEIAGDALPPRFQAQLRRFRYGVGVFKVDWALAGPIPWTAPECHRAGTLHLVGSMDELRASEAAAWNGGVAERPLVLASQPSAFDPTRAPGGGHTAWGYCHVPNGSTVDMTARIEAQVERFAPGFRDLILARSVLSPADLERHDANLVGGDVNGGAPDLRQVLIRPTPRLDPYSTPVEGLYLCSASTPPGGAVHGMCGFNAAESAIRKLKL